MMTQILNMYNINNIKVHIISSVDTKLSKLEGTSVPSVE